jgi:hypothetical protein
MLITSPANLVVISYGMKGNYVMHDLKTTLLHILKNYAKRKNEPLGIAVRDFLVALGSISAANKINFDSAIKEALDEIPDISQDKLVEEIATLAKYVYVNDGWMIPAIDKINKFNTYEDFLLDHRAGWEATDHFRMKYSDEISALVNKSLPKKRSSEEFIDAFLDAIDMFWDTWEELSDLRKLFVEAKHKDAIPASV